MFGSLTTEAQAAISAAISAANAIMEIYVQDFDTIIKVDGSPLTIADLASNQCLHEWLEPTGIPIISEETEQETYEKRQHFKRVWCVDPLDGTKEFIKKNDEFAVCVALIENNRPIFGLIASPVHQTICVGSPLFGAYLFSFQDVNDSSLWKELKHHTSLNEPLVIAGSRSHLSGTELQFTNTMKEKYGEVTFWKKGSALKFIDLAEGKADIYPRFAPTMEWDIAAGQAILEALGGAVLHAETNEPLVYNRANLVNPYFVAYTASVMN